MLACLLAKSPDELRIGQPVGPIHDEEAIAGQRQRPSLPAPFDEMFAIRRKETGPLKRVIEGTKRARNRSEIIAIGPNSEFGRGYNANVRQITGCHPFGLDRHLRPSACCPTVHTRCDRCGKRFVGTAQGERNFREGSGRSDRLWLRLIATSEYSQNNHNRRPGRPTPEAAEVVDFGIRDDRVWHRSRSVG